MKRFVKIVSLLLAVTMIAGLLVSCQDRPNIKDGEILAVYNGTPVYESEVQDIINYTLVTRLTKDTTEEQMKIMMGEAIGVYVQYKVLELDFNERKIKINEKDLKARVKAEKEAIEENYEGGYKNWMKNHGVSEDFLAEEVRRYVLADMYFTSVSDSVTVTEEEMKAYMNLHASKYYNPAGYEWTIVFREVKDVNDANECAAAESEAQAYINQIQNGETTLEEVKIDLLEKYTRENGYGKAELYSGSDFTDMQTMPGVGSDEAYQSVLEGLDKVYEDRDPNAEKSSQQYANYMNWLAECFEAGVYHALQTIEAGEVYDKPIKSFIGYGIVRLDSIVTEASFDKFEDIKDELSFEVLNEKLQTMLTDHLEALHHKYEVQYLYSDL